MWSRNRANLYIRDAMADFHPDTKAFLSPPRQGSMYRQKLECTHLIGFGSGAAGGVTPFADVTSWSFDGVDGELNIPDHADWLLGGGTGNFTIDFWLYHKSGPEDYCFAQYQGNNDRWFIQVGSTGSVTFLVDTDVSRMTHGDSGAGAIQPNEWTHVAGIRGWGGDANEWALAINGVETGTTQTNTASVQNLTGGLFIGERGNNASWATNNMDELRISNVARWTADFSTPTEQYTSDANTSLLIHGSEAVGGGTFIDSGNTGHTVSVLGGATQDTVIYR
jgi:hypothetical protein